MTAYAGLSLESKEFREVTALNAIRRSRLLHDALLLSFLTVLGASGVYLLLLGHALRLG